MHRLTMLTLLIVACATPAQQAPEAKADPAAPVHESAAPAATPPPPESATAAAAPAPKNQPAHIKLKLGHYRNRKLGIGVTIDRTEVTENVADIDPAKLRFDGETKVWKLRGQHGPSGRLDFVHDGGGVMLHVWDDGRMAVYVPDPDTGKWSDEIAVDRDADADPL